MSHSHNTFIRFMIHNMVYLFHRRSVDSLDHLDHLYFTLGIITLRHASCHHLLTQHNPPSCIIYRPFYYADKATPRFRRKPTQPSESPMLKSYSHIVANWVTGRPSTVVLSIWNRVIRGKPLAQRIIIVLLG